MNTNTGAQSITLNLVNSCSDQSVWPAIGKSLGGGILDPLPDGIMIPPGQRYQTASIPIPWSGRVWPRQFCSEGGDRCLIGDCGSSSCWGRSSKNTTLFEVTIHHEDMYYDISLGKASLGVLDAKNISRANLLCQVDGYTMGVDIVPDNILCKSISCQAPPYLGIGKSGKAVCPSSNMVHLNISDNPSAPLGLGNVYGCVSDCSLYELDKYCCRGAFNSVDTCQPSSTWFKQVCPEAYSYAYDDKTSTYHCQPSNLTIIFGCD